VHALRDQLRAHASRDPRRDLIELALPVRRPRGGTTHDRGRGVAGGDIDADGRECTGANGRHAARPRQAGGPGGSAAIEWRKHWAVSRTPLAGQAAVWWHSGLQHRGSRLFDRARERVGVGRSRVTSVRPSGLPVRSFSLRQRALRHADRLDVSLSRPDALHPPGLAFDWPAPLAHRFAVGGGAVNAEDRAFGADGGIRRALSTSVAILVLLQAQVPDVRWVLTYREQSTNELIHDPRAKPMIQHDVPA